MPATQSVEFGYIIGKVEWQVFGSRIACIDKREGEKPINVDDFDTIVEITETDKLICSKGWDRVHITCLPVWFNDRSVTKVVVEQHAPAFKAVI